MKLTAEKRAEFEKFNGKQLELAIGALQGRPCGKVRSIADGFKRLVSLWEKAPDPKDGRKGILDRKRFTIMYDPNHQDRISCWTDGKGSYSPREVSGWRPVKQGEAIKTFENMGRELLKRLCPTSPPKEGKVMTGAEIRDLLEKDREKHFPSCKLLRVIQKDNPDKGLKKGDVVPGRTMMRVFQDYMTVYPDRGLARRD